MRLPLLAAFLRDVDEELISVVVRCSMDSKTDLELLCAAQRLEETVVELPRHFRLRTFDDLIDDPGQIPIQVKAGLTSQGFTFRLTAACCLRWRRVRIALPSSRKPSRSDLTGDSLLKWTYMTLTATGSIPATLITSSGGRWARDERKVSPDGYRCKPFHQRL